MNSKFKLGSIELPYCYHEHNSSFRNERKVEVPLGAYFLDKFNNDVFEVGCVMPHYGRGEHTIIDLTDNHPRNIKANALHWDYTGKNVLSISTIEHFMTREYGNGSNEDSITCLSKIVTEAKNYLITFPTCYNEFLHQHMKSNAFIPRVMLKRINQNENEWEQYFDFDNVDIEFGHWDGRNPDGKFNNANAEFIVTNLPELLIR